MGFFTGLLTLPLAPVRGVTWVAGQVLDEVERQTYDEAGIRRELMALELDYEDGRIDEQEREALEQELLERLAASQARAAYLAGEDFSGALPERPEGGENG